MSVWMCRFCFFFVFMSQASLFGEELPKQKEEYRNYSEGALKRVKEFYRENHTFQTLDFVCRKQKEYVPLNRGVMGIWEAIELLDTLVDESDPDIALPQSYHAYQTAEALRKDGHPRWLILTGFIHDLGKMLALYGEPQWAVVGDSFPLGCPFSDKIVFPEYFENNPDLHNTKYQAPYGIYAPGCGFDQLKMSFGHDEYLYQVVKDYMPQEASYIIRYHSFYAAHKEGAYSHFMDDKDKALMPWLKLFCHYDLYSKSDEPLDIEALKSYYQELVAEFFPEKLAW